MRKRDYIKKYENGYMKIVLCYSQNTMNAVPITKDKM